jgi:uncharacterized protein (TIRG00374 family)
MKAGDLVKILLTVVALVYLFSMVDLALVWKSLWTTNPLAYIFATAMVIISIIVKAFKWKILLREGDLKFLTRSYFVGMLYGVFTPSKLGDFIRGFHVNKKYKVGITRGTISVMFDRLLDLLVVFIFAAISLSIIVGAGFGNDFLMMIIVAAIVGIILGYVYLDKFISPFIGLFSRIIGHGKLKITKEKFREEMLKTGYKKKSVFLITFAIWITNLIGWWLFAMVLGLDISFAHFFAATNIGTIVGLLPITVGGFGAREATNVYLLSLYGVPTEIGFMFSIMAALIGIVFPGLIGAYLNLKSDEFTV